MKSSRIRVLVVEDSLTIRRHLVDVLGEDPALEVVGEAEDGEAAVEACARLEPDVVTLDVVMPRLDGLQATERIMARCPTPIVIVSALENRRELFPSFDALAAGAVDVVEKPTGLEPDDRWERHFRSTIRIASRIKVFTRRARAPKAATRAAPRLASPTDPAVELIALGASTGGPRALATVLRALPATFPIPILLVLHIGEPFSLPFADWLDAQSKLPVRMAIDGEPLPRVGRPGVIVAPPDRHLELMGGRLRCTKGPERHSCRPSVDVLFESLARELGPRCAAALFTGMGVDGASGLLELRRAGSRTLAQDEATSVVYGMPGEAARLGAAEQILALDQIAGALQKLAGAGRGRR